MPADAPSRAPIERVVVLGAGAIGSLIGGKLAKTLPVVLIGRDEHMRAVAARGLRLTGLSDETVRCGERLAALTRLEDLAVPLNARDAVILAVKAAQAAEAARALMSAPGTPPGEVALYALQNGTGYEDALRAAVPEAFALRHAVVHLGATYAGPGCVEEWGGEILLPDDARSAELAEKLVASGLGARSLPDLEVWRWKKIAFNCALNAFSGIWEVRNRETIVPELLPLRRAVLAEVREEAAAAGVQLPGLGELLAEFEARARASNNVNSLLQDLRRGRPTEVGFLNEAILHRARAAGREALVNGTLAAWIRRLESAQESARPGLREMARLELLALADDPRLR
ncbi:MAG: ketopantoate reductase family protein [Planctomycetota bacterium]|nr:ketopantoate reductase family protein [Planctomycetota bacterium]